MNHCFGGVSFRDIDGADKPAEGAEACPTGDSSCKRMILVIDLWWDMCNEDLRELGDDR